jgi:hypothetical protein
VHFFLAQCTTLINHNITSFLVLVKLIFNIKKKGPPFSTPLIAPEQDSLGLTNSQPMGMVGMVMVINTETNLGMP